MNPPRQPPPKPKFQASPAKAPRDPRYFDKPKLAKPALIKRDKPR